MKYENCNLEEMLERQKEKTVYCFGAGKLLQEMLEQFEYLPWQDKIKGIVDNQKRGVGYEIDNTKYVIQAPEELIKDIKGEDAVLITCTYIYDIYRQLDQYSELSNTKCYIYQYMSSIPLKEKINWKENVPTLIPPVIHYCWFGKGALTDLNKKCIDSWRCYCPDYEIREWNEDNCGLSENEYAKQAYDCGKYGFVSDYFRLQIIYENGGIYLDTDVELLRNLDPLRKNVIFFGLQDPGVVNTGLGFGAVAHQFLIKRMLDRYKGMTFLSKDGSINDLACTFYQTQDLMDIGMRKGNRTQNFAGITVYSTQVLNPKNRYTGQIYRTENTFSIHHFDASWLDEEKLFTREKRIAQAKEIMDE